MASLRFGPNPPDLPLADTRGREAKSAQTRTDFRVVRFRVAGGWALGVIRAWRLARAGALLVQIEAVSPLTPEAKLVWYRFVPESVDPVQIEPQTGELRLTPPGERGTAGRGRIEPHLDGRCT